MEERMGEYEAIVIEQREKLIKLEDENCNLKRDIKELIQHTATQEEQFNLRLRNMQELQKKQELL